jgi:hypothetical protein
VRALAIFTLTAVALLAPAAAASARNCAKRGTLASGKLDRLFDGKILSPGGQVHRPDAYRAERDSKVRFSGVVYRFRRGSEFYLGCFGRTSQNGRTPYPRMELHKGHAKMIARRGTPGAISTTEALSSPYRNRGMRIVVTRRLKKPNSRFGRSTVDKVHGHGRVEIVPYLGPKPGIARHVDGGVFVSKRIEGGYVKGTAHYRR